MITHITSKLVATAYRRDKAVTESEAGTNSAVGCRRLGDFGLLYSVLAFFCSWCVFQSFSDSLALEEVERRIRKPNHKLSGGPVHYMSRGKGDGRSRT